MLYFLLFVVLPFFFTLFVFVLSSFSVCFYFGLIFVFLPFFDFLSLFSRCPPLSYIYCLTKTFQDPHSRWCDHSDTLTLLTSVLTGLTVRVKKTYLAFICHTVTLKNLPESLQLIKPMWKAADTEVNWSSAFLLREALEDGRSCEILCDRVRNAPSLRLLRVVRGKTFWVKRHMTAHSRFPQMAC